MGKKKTEMRKKGKNKRPSTQASLQIAEIKDGTVILKDGTLRAVMMVGSINFALKSEDEQQALIQAYVGFLNGLSFPMQIVVQSRQLQIKPYIQKLFEHEQEQQNELLRIQIADYRAFVQELVDIGQIMTKRFYVVVPYDPLSNKKKSFWSRMQEVLKPSFTIRLKEDRFQKRKRDLDVRVRQVVSGLQSLSLNVVQLDTQSLIELYYSTYNPNIAFTEELGKIEDIQVETL